MTITIIKVVLWAHVVHGGSLFAIETFTGPTAVADCASVAKKLYSLDWAPDYKCVAHRIEITKP